MITKDTKIESSCSEADNAEFFSDQHFFDDVEREKFVTKIALDESEKKGEIAIYSLENSSLSINMPILENLGFLIDSEMAIKLTRKNKELYCRKYFVKDINKESFLQSKENIAAIIDATLKSHQENSSLNALAYLANLTPRQILLLNAISVYLDQLIPILSEKMITNALITHFQVANYLIHYFEVKFDPEGKNRKSSLGQIEEKFFDYLQKIDKINEDRVIRLFFKIIQSLLRTNYYFNHDTVAVKVDVRALESELGGLQPHIEAFIFHHDFMGCHLRRSNVSRGGLRWSDRHDDFRDEVKALMKAQRAKNSVIIPSGAKGGFVIKKINPTKAEFEEVYRRFIHANLDLVDNRVDDKIVRDSRIVAYDGEDSYFVVAADKGTSSMSDTANAISCERNFWLEDAFASGGSKGYNHKNMGITAKGSIKSTERFFLEKGINFYEKSITVVGLGSPSGDVFGNGIQLSDKFLLVAAIGGREVFIDPNPNAIKSYQIRKGLFLAGQNWSHYPENMISKGGGVFKKNAKSITLSKEIKKLLNIKKDVVNGEELTRAVLCMKVDMFFNGGVGTYVKASDENNAEIGDKPNEAVRINANELKALVVCEGGNLGLTQKARIEYAKLGGKINMDSIDNSAGVNTSDMEVNLKIILNALVSKESISEENRLELLNSMIPNVEKSVLWTNYFQALSISLDEERSRVDMKKFMQTINVLDDHVENFNRYDFDIPNGDEIHQIIGKNGALIRPILSTLTSYTKIFVKTLLIEEHNFIASEYAMNYLYSYFPKTFTTIYKNEIEKHPLRYEIIATTIASRIINAQGVSFISDYSELGQAKFLLKIKSFLLINELYSANDIRFEIYRSDYQLPTKKQYDLLLNLGYSINFSIDWILEHGEYKVALQDHLSEYKNALASFLQNSEAEYIKNIIPGNDRINRFFSMLDYIQLSLTVISVKESTHQDYEEVANIFLTATNDLQMFYVIDEIKAIKADNEWEEQLRSELEKDTFETIFKIIEIIMNFKRANESIKEAYQLFVELNSTQYKNYLLVMNKMKNESFNDPFIPLTVVINSLKKIVYAATN
jgi:glutamate dehydrogenase